MRKGLNILLSIVSLAFLAFYAVDALNGIFVLAGKEAFLKLDPKLLSQIMTYAPIAIAAAFAGTNFFGKGVFKILFFILFILVVACLVLLLFFPDPIIGILKP